MVIGGDQGRVEGKLRVFWEFSGVRGSQGKSGGIEVKSERLKESQGVMRGNQGD